jgi:pantoate--beta-alanine ligase
MKLAIAETISNLNHALAAERSADKRIAFVPTMGALHDGHLALVALAKQHADVVVVSIFVNPKQFGANEDLEKYPRTIDADIEKLQQAKADMLFLPNEAVMYPPNFASVVSVPSLAKRWDGEFRQGHFDGVATVVARLFGLVKPHKAIFGEKDFQQLAIIRRMVDDLALNIEIIGAPTVREADGLAMSSRNRYLSEQERKIAPTLYQTMQQVAQGKRLDAAKTELLEAGFSTIDYLALVDAHTLEPLDNLQKPARLLAAVWLGNTRLIDNIELN